MEQMMNKEGMGMEMAGASMAAGKKEGKGMMMGMMMCAVLAIAGIGFGVYEMTQANSAKQQIADLKVEIKKDDGTTTSIETDKIEVKEDTQTITITDSAKTKSGPYIEEGYFYVPDWGWKFKIPSDLVGLGFSVDYDEAHIGYDLPFIGFTAYPGSSLIEHPQAQYYDDILTCSIINVNKTAKGENNYGLSEDDKEIDGSILRISKYTSGFCDFNDSGMNDSIYEELKAMFQNPERI